MLPDTIKPLGPEDIKVTFLQDTLHNVHPYFFPLELSKDNNFSILDCGRCGGLMVSVLDSGSSGPGSGPGRGHCVVLLGKTIYSHGASLHPGV